MMKRVTIMSVLVGSLYGIPSNVSADAFNNKNEKVIIFKESVSKESMQQVIKDKALKVTYQIPELKLIVVQDSHSKLRESKFIESVFSSSSLKPIAREENPSLNKETFSLWEAQWDMKQITGDKLSYSLHQANKGTVVAIIDSGINDEHQDLKDSVVKGSKNLVPVGGYNGTESTELGNKNDYKDRMGHGTGVAGQISANGKLHGVAPGIGIRSYRVFGEKSAKTEWILKAIIEAANDDADVINLSLGEYMLVSGQYKDGTNDLKEYKAYKKAVDYAYKKGSIVVAAAGNAGVNVRNQNDMKELFTLLGNDLDESSKNKKVKIYDMPAQLSKVVSVGSIGPLNTQSIFSNYGRNFIDYYAAGGDFSYLNQYGQEKWMEEGWFEKELILTTGMDGGYYQDAGVSYAAPKVSGAIALLISKEKLKNKPNKALNQFKKLNQNKYIYLPNVLK